MDGLNQMHIFLKTERRVVPSEQKKKQGGREESSVFG